jgi:aldehyde dehydrogenase (NAD+)
MIWKLHAKKSSVPIIRVAEADDSLRVADDAWFRLVGAMFTSDLDRETKFAHQMQVGMAHVNDRSIVDLPNSPFGGEKLRHWQVQWHLGDRSLHNGQWVTVQHTPRRYPWNARDVQGSWS